MKTSRSKLSGLWKHGCLKPEELIHLSPWEKLPSSENEHMKAQDLESPGKNSLKDDWFQVYEATLKGNIEQFLLRKVVNFFANCMQCFLSTVHFYFYHFL